MSQPSYMMIVVDRRPMRLTRTEWVDDFSRRLYSLSRKVAKVSATTTPVERYVTLECGPLTIEFELRAVAPDVAAEHVAKMLASTVPPYPIVRDAIGGSESYENPE